MNAIIAGTDGSDRSAGAVEWAADEAARRDCPLHIVHTVPWLYGTPVDPRTGVVPEEVIARGQRVLDDAVSMARGRVPEVAVGGELMVGTAAQVLLERAQDAVMIVVGAHGTGTLTSLLPGSTALQVVTHTRVPAVVVRPPEPGPWQEIAVGVDGADKEEPTLRFAFEEAALRKARLRVVHAWSHPSVDWPGAMEPLVYDRQIISDEERKMIDGTLEPWRGEFPDVELITDVVHGRPVRILAGVSARADLLVVGTRGRGGFAGLLLGSVSHAVLHHAHCPVAVVPSASS